VTRTNVLFVLVILISGYLICSGIHLVRYRLKHSSGYHTFLMSAGAGLLVLSVAYLLRLLAVGLGLDWSLVAELMRLAVPSTLISHETIFLVELSLGMLLVAACTPPLIYWLVARYTTLERRELFMGAFIEEGDSPEFLELLLSSHQYGLPILFTLSDRKVFVGYPIKIQSEKFNDVLILPVVSGYRDKDRVKFRPVTHYERVIKNELEGTEYEMFAVSLPIREIVHAHLMDLKLFDIFVDNEVKPDSDPAL
jgi:hypothetical protein